MSEINDHRGKQIEDLESFIQVTQKRLNNIVSSLGWTLESVSEESCNTVTCPFNNGHRIQEVGLEGHLEKCQWKAEGYMENELPLSEACTTMNSSSAIKFDEQLQDTVLLKARQENPTMQTDRAIASAAGVAERLIPRTSDRLVASFTRDERKAMYDYVVANTIKLDIGDDIADINKTTQKDSSQPRTSLLELLAQERNLKRRRAKHRGVHTNKKSQVEILREVINQQMEMYEEYLADSSIKSESKSPNRLETSSLDSQTSVERKIYQPPTAAWPSRKSSSKNENKYFDRSANCHTVLSPKRSPEREYSFNRDKKRQRSESKESDRRKYHSKHKRNRSQDRRKRTEGRHERCRTREDKNSEKEDPFERKNDGRKRHHSHNRGNEYIEIPKRREYSSDKYWRDQREVKGTDRTDRSRKKNY